MNPNLISAARLSCVAALFLLLASTGLPAQAGDLKLESQLIWATNDSTSPDAKHKPVEPDVRKKLGDLPLKWANYFQVCKQRLDVPEGAARRATMSDKCEIEVRNLGGSKVEVSLFGKRELVWRRTQLLPRNEILVLGGNAPNSTAWLVTLKRIE